MRTSGRHSSAIAGCCLLLGVCRALGDGAGAASDPKPDAADRWIRVRDELLSAPGTLDGASAALLARAQRQLGDREAARRTVAEGLARDPKSEALWRERLGAELDAGNLTLARQSWSEACEALGEPPWLSAHAARIFAGMGAWIGELCTVTAPRGRCGEFSGGRLLLRVRQRPGEFVACGPDGVMYHVRRALDAGEQDARLHVLHARAWLALDMPDAAAAILDAHRAEIEELVEPHATRVCAEAFLASGRLDDYLRSMRKLAADHPATADDTMFEAFDTLAEQYNLRGEEALALAHLLRASDLRPTDCAASLRAADALWTAGRQELAQARYRAALENCPGGEDRLRMLERMSP